MAKLEDYEAALIAADRAGNVEDAKRLAGAIVTLRSSQPEKFDPTADMSGPQKFLAGAGKGMNDLGRGAGQMLGLVDQKSIDEERRLSKPLMNTGAGIAGNVTGSIAAAAPMMFIPGANTVAGAALVGGGLGAIQPTAEGESRLQNTITGAAMGGGTQYGLGKLAGIAGNRLATATQKGVADASRNSVRDATLREVQAAGYSIPPSQAGAGVGSRVLEGVSGKYKTNQAFAIKDQNVTDRLARQALGLADDEPITREAMQTVRDRAFQRGYEPVANAGAVETDTVFKKALDNIVQDYQGAARSFPGGVKNEVMERIDSLRTGVFDTGDALKMTRILRDEANAAYAGGNNALGKATKGAAKAIEDQVERALQAAGKDGADMLKEFRSARQLMAKAHSVERAIVEGGGHVNAKVLGTALQRGKPLTDELRTIGLFGNNFKDIAGIPQSGWANPLTVMDAFGAAMMGAGGAGIGAAALPAARIASRSAILSNPYQRAFVKPQNYGPGLLSKMTPKMLKELEKRGAGGLLGLTDFSQ